MIQDFKTFKHISNVRIVRAILTGNRDTGGFYGWGMVGCVEPVVPIGALPCLEMQVNSNFRGGVRIEYNSANATYNCLFSSTNAPKTQNKAVFSVLWEDLFDVLDKHIRRGGLSLEAFENAILDHTYYETND